MARMNPPTLTPEMAALITRHMHEYTAINRHRLLVDTLMKLGVTQDVFREWLALCRQTGATSVSGKNFIGVPSYLTLDTENLFSSIRKGTTVPANELVQTSPRFIAKVSNMARKAQEQAIANFHEANNPAEDEPPSHPAPKG